MIGNRGMSVILERAIVEEEEIGGEVEGEACSTSKPNGCRSRLGRKYSAAQQQALHTPRSVTVVRGRGRGRGRGCSTSSTWGVRAECDWCNGGRLRFCGTPRDTPMGTRR